MKQATLNNIKSCNFNSTKQALETKNFSLQKTSQVIKILKERKLRN